MKIFQWIFLAPRNFLIGLVLTWRKIISPLYGNVCRYWPSCSSYGLQSLQQHGVIKGLSLTIWRVLRCNPWSPGGIDEVKPGPEWVKVSKLGFVSLNTQENKR